jgi:hypothetical protein
MRLKFFEQPDSRQCPVSFHRARRNSERRSDLLYGEAAKVSQFDDLGLTWILLLQPVESLIELRDLFEPLGRYRELILELDSFSLAAALIGVAGAGVVDEHSPHNMSGEAYEMFTAVPIDVLLNKAQVGLIDEGGGLQRVVGPLSAHVGVGNAMELRVNEGQESFGRRMIAGMHGLQKPRCLASILIHRNVQGPCVNETYSF